MFKKIYKKSLAVILSAVLSMSLIACGSKDSADTEAAKGGTEASSTSQVNSEESSGGDTTEKSDDTEKKSGKADKGNADSIIEASTTSGGAMETTDLFSERDLTQEADLSEAKNLTVTSGENLTITEAGVYVITGTAENTSIIVDAPDDAKVQLVLSNLSITNEDSPAVYVKSADKVFVTTEGDNSLSVTGTFTADGDTNTDAVIFSKDDIVLNGTGTLTIVSSDNGISGKDDLKITGGTLNITCEDAAIEANDSIRIADGSITIKANKDGLHAENDDDDSVGYIYICGGSLTIDAADDGIHATTIVQIDGGKLDITAAEGIEGTYVQVNGGTIDIAASDDGINAANKSSVYSVQAEFNGGEVNITMGQGDTDGVDVNGNLTINGGTISVDGQSSFDYDGTLSWNGGTVIVNGEEVSEISNQVFGPGGGNMGPGSNMGPGGNGDDPFDGNFPGGDMTPPDGFGGDFPDGKGPGGRNPK